VSVVCRDRLHCVCSRRIGANVRKIFSVFTEKHKSYLFLSTSVPVRGSSFHRLPFATARHCYLLLLLFSFIVISNIIFDFSILHGIRILSVILISQLSLSPPFIESVLCFTLLRFFFFNCRVPCFFPFAVYCDTTTQGCFLRRLHHI